MTDYLRLFTLSFFHDKNGLTMRAGGLGGGPGEMEESKRKHFPVSLAGSPTKPLTRAVGLPIAQ